MRKIVTSITVLVLILQMFSFSLVAQKASAESYSQNLLDQFQVSPGVTYKNMKLQSSSTTQVANVLDIQLSDPFTSIEVGIPSPLDKLTTVSSSAKANSSNEHQVVGAINGSFYHTSNGLPAYLIAKDNQIYNGGTIASGRENYVNEAIAFGILSNGQASIDHYEVNISLAHNGSTYQLNGINRGRDYEELIVYTPSHSNGYTNTNEYGTEFVVTTDQPLEGLPSFGDVYNGTVQSIRQYGDKTNTAIPKNGFVLSMTGKWNERLQHVKVGDQLQVSLGIDSQWQNAKYMLTSGPMLVKDGKPYLTIDENSSRAKEKAPRSAVAIDSSKNRVFFVTVDGRQSGYSTGMNLKEFAEYVASLGADRAINLDGGGSTTMVAREHGDQYASVANKPSDGRERAVSTSLHVVSSAPNDVPATIELHMKEQGKVVEGASVEVVFDYVIDKYYNPLSYDSTKLSLQVTNNLGRFEGMKFIAEKSGTGKIIATYEGAVKELPITVVDTIDKLTISPDSLVVASGQTQQMNLQASDSNGDKLIYNSSLVSWSVTEGIGTISNSGLFTAADAEGSGKITATLGKTSVSVPVTVNNKPLSLDSFDDVSKWVAESARASASIAKSSESEPRHEGSASLKLTYDFSVGEEGVAAAYVTAKQPIKVSSKPLKLGLWVYGDGNNHWLRGKINDSTGKTHTIDFTSEGGLTWTGWKYVEADIPQDITAPIEVSKVYVAEGVKEKQGTGEIYFDKLQAVFSESYNEQLFSDVPEDSWAVTEIEYLASKKVINGYPDGSFLPYSNLTRAHAAVLLDRALNLDTSNITNPNFKDVPTDHQYYKTIAAVANAGIVKGKEDGSFDPEGTLTRAQMAAILQRAYDLVGQAGTDFKDVPVNHWAYKEISALAANGVTTGYEDQTFKPNNYVNRAQFSAFLYRIFTK
ncbi:S-layer homology domain-containing protein [Cytobacillus sp. IB215665]|uniref:S-layer homology domain-containing protein n=1 Tax=Cytobacillus sp. IB215665 TaxID=3097357 RepID=UPI002A0F18B3|nr:S-layer homology domain-containing protein [Cytobacillus sp. IB215665]MDX8363798.1 S-layer homology domain-containing protein [Cytobacillus sp. IB215665]